MDSFIAFIRQFVPVSPEIKETLTQVMKEEELPKGHVLLKEGMVAHRLYFLEKGIARTYYYHDGKEITSWIYPENSLLTSWYSFLSHQPSFEYLELLETSRVLSISNGALQKLYDTHPVLDRFGRVMVEQQLVFMDIYFKGYQFMNAREKYDLFLSSFPDAVQRVNLGYIASMLGITQETLSRIRGKTS